MLEFKMPSLGADMEDGLFVQWMVEPGQAVRRGDVVCVVETQKGAVDVEIWDSGTIARLIAAPGQKIPVGQTLALLAAPGEPLEAIGAGPLSVGLAAALPASGAPATAISPAPAAAAPEPAPDARLKVSPAARHRAGELKVDLSRIRGSGVDGAITLADVESAAAGATQPTRAAGMREAIATAMSRSKHEIPHYYVATDINVERPADWLEKLNSGRPITERILFVALTLKAIARALADVPELNGTFAGGAFCRSESIHIGVVTSLRGGGIVVPAVHDVDRLALPELMGALRDVLARARAGKLRSSDLADGTITVTNMGDLGVETVFGVIYPPQVALVGLGRVVAKPWAVNGSVVVARSMGATLSGDHRVTDGLSGARFLAGLREQLDHPEAL